MTPTLPPHDSGADEPTDGTSALGPLSQLAIAAQSGERGALAAFAHAIVPHVGTAVRTSLTATLRSRCTRGDVVNTCWIVIQEGLHSLEVRGDPELISWVRRAVVRKILDLDEHERAQCRDPTRTRSLDAMLQFGDTATPPELRTDGSPIEEQVIANEEFERVCTAFARLPPLDAEVIRAIDFDGMSFAEAGRALGIAKATARSRYANGKARLAALLSGGPG